MKSLFSNILLPTFDKTKLETLSHYQTCTFRCSYATANGIMVVEQGRLARAGTPSEAQTVEGTYTYLNGDGTLVNVRYFADEGGFRAVPNVIHRPSARFQSTHPGGVLFQTHEELQRSLRTQQSTWVNVLCLVNKYCTCVSYYRLLNISIQLLCVIALNYRQPPKT